jgi:putative spermidine/putrescine transport system substrate-binding protein
MSKSGVRSMSSQRNLPSEEQPRLVRAGMTRRQVLRAAVVGGMVAANYLPFPHVITAAKAAPKQMKIGIWAGPDGQLIKSTVIEKFEKQYNVKVFVDEGITTEQLARLRAGKNNPTHTVMFMDDIGVSLARQEGLLAPLPEAQIPNMSNVFPRYLFEDGYGVGIQVSTVALTYSTQAIQAPPTSWEAFWDPRYQGQVSVPSIASTNGLNILVAGAAVETGKPFQEAQYETEAAFKRLAMLKDNLYSVWSKTALSVAAMQQGEVALLGPMYSKFIWPYIDRGLAARHVVPKEGAFAGVNCQTLVKGGPHPELGAAFINAILAPDTQQTLATTLSIAPVVKGIDLPPNILERVDYTEARQQKLFTSDWAFLNKVRPEWTERWNNIFV